MNKKSLAFALALLLVLGSVFSMPAKGYASTNGAHIPGMTDEMYQEDYWCSAIGAEKSEVLMTKAEIAAMNRLCMDTPATLVNDFTAFTEDYDATKLRESLAAEALPAIQYYIDGKPIINEEYFGGLDAEIKAKGWMGERKVLYAICSTHADIKAYPTNSMIMDSLTDTADEMQLSSLLVNEPFVIMQKCEREGTIFYWGYADNVSGWVDGAKLAICESKEEWLDAWKIDDIEGKDFLVVTDDHITIEPSIDPDYPAGMRLAMGVTLKLVAKEDVPVTVGERGTLVNYVVYVPTRDADGKYVRKMALIPVHAGTHEGYLTFTIENMLKLAFGCEGNRYGWGNMLENLDCSGYVRNILRCFGFTFPRNTTWQRNIPGTQVDLRGLTDSQKTAVLKTLPVSTPLYMPGHAMVYIGVDNGTPYVISSTALFALPEGDPKTVKYLSVLPSPMTIRKGSGKTWLELLETAVVLNGGKNIAEYELTAAKDPGQGDAQVVTTVKKDDKVLQQGVDYQMILPDAGSNDRTVIVTGCGEYFGYLKADIEINGCVCGFVDVPEDADFAGGVRFCVENGLMVGTSRERFSPNASLTIAQAMTVLAKIDGKDGAESWKAAYEEFGNTVLDRETAKEMIGAFAAERGLDENTFASFADVVFGDGDKLTRGQFATLIAELAE